MLPEIDYIIPTWNSGATLGITLQAIRKYGHPHDIIILDRNSKDDTGYIAQQFGCKVITSTRSLGAARRQGAGIAKTDLVAYIDSDVEINEQWQEVLYCAWERKYKDAGVIGAYYKGSNLDNITSHLALYEGNGAFGCIVTSRDLVLECTELDDYSSAEDRIFARFLKTKGLKWYILPVGISHYQNITKIPYYSRWRWLGAGLRTMEGFRLVNVKRIMGGAVFGIKMNNLDIDYWENFRIRYNYFIGYIKYKEYYELDRDSLIR